MQCIYGEHFHISEQIGAQVMEDLSSQRQTIQRSRNRVCICYPHCLCQTVVVCERGDNFHREIEKERKFQFRQFLYVEVKGR